MTFKEFHEAANREIDRYYGTETTRCVTVEVWDRKRGREVTFGVWIDNSDVSVEEWSGEAAIAEVKKQLADVHKDAPSATSVDSIGDIPSVGG